MSEKISIKFKPQLEQKITEIPKEKIKIIENQPKPKPKLSDHIRNNFICPLERLIKNDGVSNNTLIASVDALYIMREILDSIINRCDTNIVEILEKAAYEELDDQIDLSSCKENREQEVEEISNIDDDDEYLGEDEDDEEEKEDDEEEDDEYDYYENMEIDSYIQEEKLNDDEENMYD